MLDRTTTRVSHVKPGDTPFRSDGLRDYAPDRESPEVAGPADFTTVAGPCPIPETAPWP